VTIGTNLTGDLHRRFIVGAVVIRSLSSTRRRLEGGDKRQQKYCR
jgi:hypothetical protein